MKKELFDELVASVREGGAILRGKVAPSRKFVSDGPNVKRIRTNYKLSQGEFAALLGISVATLQNWEQGRRTPKGAARVLLQVASKHPHAVWDVVRPVDRNNPSLSTRNQSSKHNTAKATRRKTLRRLRV